MRLNDREISELKMALSGDLVLSNSLLAQYIERLIDVHEDDNADLKHELGDLRAELTDMQESLEAAEDREFEGEQREVKLIEERDELAEKVRNLHSHLEAKDEK